MPAKTVPKLKVCSQGMGTHLNVGLVFGEKNVPKFRRQYEFIN